MDYNSIEEIFAAGTTNMTVIRNNTKQDDGTDTITGVSWFTFNGTAATTIYASGNSWIGLGSSTEHLKVNRRDGAMYSLYREEGTLYGHYRFLKIRWVGYSRYNSTTSAYAITYDVILWDTGDISLHMVSIPTSYNDGTYSLTAASTYSYTVSTASPDVTFTKTDSGFTVSNSIIELELPYGKRYLIRSGSIYYTVIDNALAEVAVDTLTSSVFLNSGATELPPISLLLSVPNGELLYWRDTTEGTLEKGLVVTGTPVLPQVVYYEPQDVSSGSINKAEVVASDDVVFSVSCDGGSTWQYYNGNAWVNAASETDGMNADAIKAITPDGWGMLAMTTTCQFRCVLPALSSRASKIYINIV